MKKLAGAGADRGVYPKGVGRAISHISKSGVDGLVIWITYFWYSLVNCWIRHPSDAYSKQRLFEASVRTVCLCKQHIAQYCGDSDNRIRASKPHRAKK